ALDVAVVVDLDPVERRLKPEGGGDSVEQLTLRGALGQPSAERLSRRRGDAVDQLLFVAALRHRQRDPAAAQRQRLLHQSLLDQAMAEQQQRRLWPIVIELTDKAGQHLFDAELAVVAREVGAVAPIVATAEKEYLDAGMPSGLIGRDDIGVDDAGDM